MSEYHKIQTYYLRDPDNNYKTLLMGQYARPEFEYLAELTWVWTEKVDGTNIRLIPTGAPEVKANLRILGKSDRAEIPKPLRAFVDDHFKDIDLTEYVGLVLYGEGYGPGIQKGGVYRTDQDFCLFDVATKDGMFLERENVEDIGSKLGLAVAPIIAHGTPPTVIHDFETNPERFTSLIAYSKVPMEGLVGRPQVELRNRQGERVITKIKRRDFSDV